MNLPTELYTALETHYLSPSPDPMAEQPQTCWAVAVDTPVGQLSYAGPKDPQPAIEVGDWVLVPVGPRVLLGLVLGPEAPPQGVALREILMVCVHLPRLGAADLAFYQFVASYYRRGLGPVVATAVPTWLRQPAVHQPSKRKAGPGPSRLERLLGRLSRPASDQHQPVDPAKADAPVLTAEQQAAIRLFETTDQPVLLEGVTGSGKTQVYIEAMRTQLARSTVGQVLFLVPEIGLTPALLARLERAFPGLAMVALHSGLADQARAQAWLQAALGRVRIVVGTRTAVLCPMPHLELIIVDEEHDTSYKQQEGIRYSARDLAVWLANQRRLRLVLGSATPSLESRAQAARGRYRIAQMHQRATGAQRAQVRLIDTISEPAQEGLTPTAWRALEQTFAQGRQALVYVNRRGWAPVLACSACGWQQTCQACGVPAVLHKHEGRWRAICHHCGLVTAIPRACPDCGAPELEPQGRGSQRLEQALSDRFPEARLLRLDRDAIGSSRHLGEALDLVARGEVDLVVGTQMVAKGHDFPALSLVVVVDADQQLYNPDFRAPEWLFANLLQVSGRAGRHAQHGDPGQVLIQTRYPTHPILKALVAGDAQTLSSVWQGLLSERAAAGLPPYGHLAAVRFSHREERLAEERGRELTQHLRQWLAGQGELKDQAVVYAPVPRYPARQANRSRWQVFLESSNRRLLHALLAQAEAWAAQNRGLDAQVEVDPLQFC